MLKNVKFIFKCKSSNGYVFITEFFFLKPTHNQYNDETSQQKIFTEVYEKKKNTLIKLA